MLPKFKQQNKKTREDQKTKKSYTVQEQKFLIC